MDAVNTWERRTTGWYVWDGAEWLIEKKLHFTVMMAEIDDLRNKANRILELIRDLEKFKVLDFHDSARLISHKQLYTSLLEQVGLKLETYRKEHGS